MPEIEKRLDWHDPEIWISERCFTLEIYKNEVEIICKCDGSGVEERCWIPVEVLETALKEYKEELARRVATTEEK